VYEGRGAGGASGGVGIANRPNLGLGNRLVQNNFNNVNATQFNKCNRVANG
jgi:hypothetical protein